MEACFLTHGPGMLRKRFAVSGEAIAHPMQRPVARVQRGKLAHILSKFFVYIAPKLIGQVIVLRGKPAYVKAAYTADERVEVERILRDLEMGSWVILAGDVEHSLAEIAKDGAAGAAVEMNIDTNANRDVLNIVNKEALDYAEHRSAGMVGMRRLADGRLVPNPDAKWQITESTREMMRPIILQSINEGWTNDKLASELAAAYAFSDQRAMVIARTETILASNAGAMASYRAAGVQEKEWTTAQDDRVSEECAANGAQGAIYIDDVFESGDEMPPAHPNCRCVIVPVIRFASEGGANTRKPSAPPPRIAQRPPPKPPTVVLAPKPPAPVPSPDMPRVEWIGNVSPSFRAEALATIARFAPSVLRALARKGERFRFGENLTQIEPWLKGRRIGGKSRGPTYDAIEGVHFGDHATFIGKLTINVAENFKPLGRKTFVKSGRVNGVIAHETGHGLDTSLGKITRTLEFRTAYESDKTGILKAERAGVRGADKLDYYIQRGDTGPSEAFAEVFAHVVEGTGGSPDGVLEFFPKVTAFMRDLLARLEKEP